MFLALKTQSGWECLAKDLLCCNSKGLFVVTACLAQSWISRDD
jgi:hypothetical protein